MPPTIVLAGSDVFDKALGNFLYAALGFAFLTLVAYVVISRFGE